MADRRFEAVEGWLGTAEGDALRELVARVPGSAGVRVVEIGSWKGRSTVALAAGVAARGHGGVVHAVDPHQGAVAHRLTGDADSYDAFLSNIDDAGVRDLVDPIRATSADARPRVAEGSVDVLFVDGSHSYDDVVGDLIAWETALRPGAWIALHDAVSYPGVARVVRERVLSRGSAFRCPRRVQETLIATYRPDAPWRAGDTVRSLAMGARLTALRAARRWARSIKSRP